MCECVARSERIANSRLTLERWIPKRPAALPTTGASAANARADSRRRERSAGGITLARVSALAHLAHVDQIAARTLRVPNPLEKATLAHLAQTTRLC